MTEIDRLAEQTSTVLRGTLSRLSALASKLLLATTIVSVATYATVLWVTGNDGWKIGGAILCAIPVVAAFMAWWRLRLTAVVAPKAFDDLRALLHDNRARSAMGMVIDHDTQRPLGPTTLDLGAMRRELTARKSELPALWATIRAVTTVPALAAVATAGLVGLGFVGSVTLIVGLIT